MTTNLTMRAIARAGFGIILCASIFTSFDAKAVPVVSIGVGGAVTTADRIATFDTLTVSGIDLTHYTENMLNITVAGDTFFDSDSDPFDGGVTSGFHYERGGNQSFVTISATDDADILGLEFLIGTGYNITTAANVVWQTLSNGSITGSGTFSTTEGKVVGWSDALGFDTLLVGAWGNTYDAFGQNQAIALDDLSVELMPSTDDIPLPAALPLFGAGLASMGFFGWRSKRKLPA